MTYDAAGSSITEVEIDQPLLQRITAYREEYYVDGKNVGALRSTKGF